MPRIPQQPGLFRRFFGLKKLLFINMAAFALIVWGFSGEYMRNRRMENEIGRLQQEASRLEQKNSELADISDRFATGSMLEREARTKLNLRRPGEEVVVVREAPAVEKSPDASISEKHPSLAVTHPSNPVKWWRYFFR